MKNRKLLSILCLFSLTGCGMLSTGNSSSSSKVNSSTGTAHTSSSSVITSSSNSSSEGSNQISSSNNNVSFDSETQALFDSYFGFDIPCIDLEYDYEDLTDVYGKTCVVLYFLDATNDDLESYLTLCDTAFTFLDEGTYDGDYWYCYEKNNGFGPRQF